MKNIFEYVKCVIRDAYRSEGRDVPPCYVNYIIVTKDKNVYVDFTCPYSRVSRRVHWRLKNNLEKYGHKYRYNSFKIDKTIGNVKIYISDEYKKLILKYPEYFKDEIEFFLGIK